MTHGIDTDFLVALCKDSILSVLSALSALSVLFVLSATPSPEGLSHLCSVHLRPVSQRDTVYQPRATLWVHRTTNPGVL